LVPHVVASDWTTVVELSPPPQPATIPNVTARHVAIICSATSQPRRELFSVHKASITLSFLKTPPRVANRERAEDATFAEYALATAEHKRLGSKSDADLPVNRFERAQDNLRRIQRARTEQDVDRTRAFCPVVLPKAAIFAA
jgi:hypothetical protein